MRKLKTLLFIVIIALTPSLSMAQVSHTVQFDTADISFANRLADDDSTYTSVSISDLMFSREEGTPRLPVKFVNLIIPQGMTIDSITLSTTTSETDTLDYPVFPVQVPLLACLECDPPDFVSPDSNVYYSSNPWPADMITKTTQGYFDGCNNIVSLEICPFQYYPLTGELIYYTTISFNLVLESGYQSGITTRKRLAKNNSLYEDVLASLVDNPQDISSYTSSPTLITQLKETDPLPYYEYVIITKNDFKSSFDQFVEWKKQKGINTGVITIEEIIANYDGDEIFPGDEISDEYLWQENAGSMRQYLYDAYQEGTVWVLLAGDVTVLPVRWGTSIDSEWLLDYDWGRIIEADLYFADFNGNWNMDDDQYYGEPGNDNPDYNPEIFVGRLICSSTSDIDNWVQKVLLYEQNPGKGDHAYLTESFMTQADEFQGDPDDGQQAQAVEPHFSTFNNNIWEEYPYYDSEPPTKPTGAQVVAELNKKNYGLMAAFNHGGSGGKNSGFATATCGINSCNDGVIYKFDAEEANDYHSSEEENNDGLDNLTNYDFPFVFYSLSCSQNPYHVTKAQGNLGARNFGESFTVNNLTGGVAFLGTTHEAFIPITYHAFRSFADKVVPSENQAESHLGVAEAMSKLKTQHHYTLYSHNLIGCPETRLWTNTPSYLGASVNHEFIEIGVETDIEIDVGYLPEDREALVCLYKKGEIFQTETIEGDNSNSASVTFNDVEVQNDGDLHVTITSHNYIPYQKNLPAGVVIDSDETWNTDKTINTDIIITNCAVLTIEDECAISFNEDKKLMITPCSEVIVDHSKLTSLSTTKPWNGIEVWGNSSEHQYTISGNCEQGKLTLKDTALIENAFNAVTLWKPDDWNKRGGIIIAKNSKFKNNWRSVEFIKYANFHPVTEEEVHYNAYFSNCEFMIDGNYFISNDFNTHVSMWAVNGIKFNGCSFINDYETVPNGRAIFTHDAGFITHGYCVATVQGGEPCPTNQYVNTTFHGFYRAIESGNSANALYPIIIRQSDFTSNGYGIHFSAVNDAVVVDNEFELGYHNDCSANTSTGIYLDNCKRFAIEQNNFTLHSPANATVNFGIHTVNTNNAFDEIYKNDFDEMLVANFAEGKNWDRFWREGLAYYCNTNQNNSWDFYVDQDDGSGTHGIQSRQGNRYYVAGNTFSSGAYEHFYNLGAYKIYYYYDLGSSSQTPDANKVYEVKLFPELLSNSCPEHYAGDGDIKLSTSAYQQKESDFNSSLNSYNTALSQYNSTSDSAKRQELEDKMSYYNTLFSRAAYDMLRSNLADTLVHDSLIENLLINLDTYATAESIVDLYMQKGDYSTASEKADSLEIDFAFSAYDSVEYPYYQDLKTMQARWLEQDRYVFQLNSNEIRSLKQIADSSKGLAGAQARGILAFAGDSAYNFIHCVQTPDTSDKAAPFGSNNNMFDNGLSVVARPNPAIDQIVFDYRLPEGIESGYLHLFSSSGLLIHKIELRKTSGEINYNCAHLKQGVYLYSISCLNKTKTSKFVIIR